MSALLAPWPDAEELVMSLLAQAPDLGATIVQHLPETLGEDDEPVVQVLQVGGEDDYVTNRPLMEIAVFAGTYARARAVSETIRQRMLASGGRSVPTPTYPGGVLIDRCVTATPPQEQPYDNPDQRRKIGAYQVEYRRPYVR